LLGLTDRMIKKEMRRFITAARSSTLFFRRWLPFALLLAMPSARGAQFTLTWSDNSSNESGFRIERATGLNANSGFAQIATVGANVVSYVDAGLPNSTSYTYRLRAYNSAGTSGYSNPATGTTPPAGSNTAPTITDIADQVLNMNGTTGALAFRIGDAQTSASSLSLIRNSSNTTLIPLANITFGGSGSNRTVTVRPASNKSGYATVWVKVSDGKLTSYIGFVVSVRSGNSAPTISAISDRRIAINGTTGSISFNIGDAQTSASSLTLIKNVSNTSLIPLANVVLGGSGGNRTVTVRPSANRTGWSTVWIKVSDGQLQTYTSFVVEVAASLTATQVASSSAPTASFSQSTLASASVDSSPEESLQFEHMTLVGDSEVTVRLDALQGTSDALRAGLMYRGSTHADAACAGVQVTGAGRILFVWRSQSGGPLQAVAPLQGRAPRYLRLTRSADLVFGFTSIDGVAWDFVDYATVTLPSACLAGTTAEGPGAETPGAVAFSKLAVD